MNSFRVWKVHFYTMPGFRTGRLTFTVQYKRWAVKVKRIEDLFFSEKYVWRNFKRGRYAVAIFGWERKPTQPSNKGLE